MFDFFKELPGQEARTTSELEPPERSINFVGTQMYEEWVRVGILLCSVLSDQDRKTSFGFPSAWKVSCHLGKQIKMVRIVEAKKRWNNNHLWSSVGFEEGDGRDACCPGMQQSRTMGSEAEI